MSTEIVKGAFFSINKPSLKQTSPPSHRRKHTLGSNDLTSFKRFLTMSVFDRLPFEIRVEISHQIEDWFDFNNFRTVDATNKKLLSTSGVLKRFLPDQHQRGCIRWVRDQLQQDTYLSNLLRYILTIDQTTTILARPTMIPGKNDLVQIIRGFTFIHKTLNLAKRSTKYPLVEGMTLDYGQHVVWPSLYLQSLKAFDWHPFGFELGEEDRRKLSLWIEVINIRLELAFNATEEEGTIVRRAKENVSDFELMVIRNLWSCVFHLYDDVQEREWESHIEADDWAAYHLEVIEAMFVLIMRVFEWERLVNGPEGSSNLFLHDWSLRSLGYSVHNPLLYELRCGFDLDDNELFFRERNEYVPELDEV